MHISKQGSEVYLNILLNITNGGICTTVQDTQITLHSLMQLNNVHTMFDKYEEWDDFELAFMPNSDNLHAVNKPRESIAMDFRIRASKITPIHENDEFNSPKTDEEGDEVKMQEPLESSKLVNELEKEALAIKGDSEEENSSNVGVSKSETKEKEKVDEADDYDLKDVKEVLAPLYRNGQPTKEDYLRLLDRVRKDVLASECVDKKTPARKLSLEEFNAVILDEDNEVLNGKQWKKDPAAGLRFTDEEFLAKQKKVLGHFLRSMGKNLLEGKSIMNVSMPITIFGNESMLQRASSSFGYAPTFLSLAGQQEDKLEAFKYVIAFYFSTLHMGITQVKPFNPILGNIS